MNNKNLEFDEFLHKFYTLIEFKISDAEKFYGYIDNLLIKRKTGNISRANRLLGNYTWYKNLLSKFVFRHGDIINKYKYSIRQVHTVRFKKLYLANAKQNKDLISKELRQLFDSYMRNKNRYGIYETKNYIIADLRVMVCNTIIPRSLAKTYCEFNKKEPYVDIVIKFYKRVDDTQLIDDIGVTNNV